MEPDDRPESQLPSADAPLSSAPPGNRVPDGDELPPTTVLRRLPPAESPPTSPPDSQSTLPAPLQARADRPVVPGFEILEEIGRGGMGVVYKARQLSLDRIVALKILHPGPDGPGATLARFRSEAEAIGRLQHPHIIQVHEVGTCVGGPYFVFEYAGGGSLAGRLGGAPQPARTAAQLVSIVARAAHSAHERGVIHRDLKPSNILLSEGPGTPLEKCTPRIGDFGLARRLDDARGLTLSGQVMGTPGYMPPEQAQGPGEAIGPASDVYSLGVILYELLTGRPPYSGSTAIETIHLMLYQEPLPPSRLRRDLPRDLETICLKCLDKAPVKRYPSAANLADDLDRFLDRQPIQARPTPAWERAWKWARRRPSTAALAAGVVGLVVLCFALVTSLWLRAEAEQTRRTADRDQALRIARAEARARTEAQRLSARLLMERGLGLCEAGDLGAGLLWLIDSLETSPAGPASRAHASTTDEDGLDRSLRLMLGGWGSQLHTLLGQHLYPAEVRAVHFLDEDRLAVACRRQVHFFVVGKQGTARPSAAAVTLPGPVVALFGGPAGPVAAVVTPTALQLHRLPAGQRVGPPLPLSGQVNGVALGADGARVLVAHADYTARLWRVRDGQLVGQPWKHPSAVRAVALSRDGKWAITGCNDRQARLWSVPDGKLVRVLSHHVGPVRAVAFASDGQTIVTGGEDHRVCVWRRQTGELIRSMRHEHEIICATFQAKDNLFATGSNDNTARLWDAGSERSLGAPLQHAEDVSALAFSPSGGRLATASEDGDLRLWQLNLPTRSRMALKHPGAVLALAHSPRAPLLATACSDGAVRVWDLASGAVRAHKHPSTPQCLAFRPDGKAYAAGFWDGRLELFEVGTGKSLCPPLRHPTAVISAAFSPDGKLVATGCFDPEKVVRLWDWKRGVAVRELVGHTRRVPSLAFSPDGRRLLTGSWDYSARLWEVATGRLLGKPLSHQDLVQSVAFGPDGRMALTCGDDYMARLWYMSSRRGVPLRHTDKVQAVAFGPRHGLLASGGKAHSARLWDALTGKLVGPPLPHEGEVHALAFEPRGKHLWAGSWDGTARRWDVPLPRGESVAQLRLWVEVHTGLRLDSTGAVVSLDRKDWLQRLQALAEGQHDRAGEGREAEGK